MIVYPARDICPFVMYCVNGKPRSSLLIESTDSMISPVVLIYLRLYLYISGCTYISPFVLIISGCIYISPAVLVYLRLYLYNIISSCIYISPAVFIRPKKHLKNEQRSKDAATKKSPNTNGVYRKN